MDIEQIDMPLSPWVARLENAVVRRGFIGVTSRMLPMDELEIDVREKLKKDWSQVDKLRTKGALLGFRIQVCPARAA